MTTTTPLGANLAEYRRSQAWQNVLVELWRRGGTNPTKAVIAGRIDRGWSRERIADNWGALGGKKERCTVTNVNFRWSDMQLALKGVVPTSERGVLDIARDVACALNEGLTNPAATDEFMAAADAYYRQLHEVNPTKIRADWRDWKIRSDQR